MRRACGAVASAGLGRRDHERGAAAAREPASARQGGGRMRSDRSAVGLEIAGWAAGACGSDASPGGHAAAQTSPRRRIVAISGTSNSEATCPSALKNTRPLP